MPLAETALFTGFAHSLWSYNRENWQWDWQVKQAGEFQKQNMAVNRYELFREDIRDLAALTVNKMDSYLIVNTLKLGFIVTIFLNYDLKDAAQQAGCMVRQVTLLFSVSFLTSFLFLLISVWLAMNASIIAQSLTTKMLLQTARIPFMADGDILGWVPEAREYETRLDDAFRLPLDTKPDKACADTHGVRSSPVPWAPTSDPTVETVRGSLELAPDEGTFQEGREGAAVTSDELDANPHLKFYSLLMRNWQTFDLYSKVCMSIGTSSMLSGIAYYATYFSRSVSDGEILDPYASGWFTFAFMSVLAWWSVTIDVVLTRLEHCIWAGVSLCGPVMAAVSIVLHMRVLMPLVFVLQGCWVWLLCGSSLALRNGLPRRWRASLFIDILNPYTSNSCTGRLARPSNLSRAPPPAAAAAADQLSQCLEALLQPNVVIQLQEEAVEQVRRGRAQLEEALLHVAWRRSENSAESHAGKGSAKGFASRRAVSEGGAPSRPARSNMPSSNEDGFWLAIPTEGNERPEKVWVGVNNCGEQLPSFLKRNKGQMTSVGELLEAAAVLLRAMRPAKQLSAWTARDAGRLAAYGGWRDAACSLKSFEAQFRTKGHAANSSMGESARRFFQASAALVSVAWLVAPMTSLVVNLSQPDVTTPEADMDPGFFLSVMKISETALPRSWMIPSSASCTPDAQQLIVSDGVRAYWSRMNETGYGWLGPSLSCSGAFISAVAFSGGDAIAARILSCF